MWPAAVLLCMAACHKVVRRDTARVDEPDFEPRAVGPLDLETPLQMVSLFAYEPGEVLVSPAVELAAIVADARVKDGFGRVSMAALPVSPTPRHLKASQLLVLAWGPRAELTLSRVKEMGHAAMKEAIAREAEEFAYAPLLQDQGVTTLAPDAVAAAFMEGALDEYLDERRDTPVRIPRLQHVIYEATPATFDAVTAAAERGLSAAREGHKPPAPVP
jgi:hypothetical protein